MYKTYEENNKNYSEMPSEHVSLLHENFLNGARTTPLERSLTMSPRPDLIELMQTAHLLSLRLTAFPTRAFLMAHA